MNTRERDSPADEAAVIGKSVESFGEIFILSRKCSCEGFTGDSIPTIGDTSVNRCRMNEPTAMNKRTARRFGCTFRSPPLVETSGRTPKLSILRHVTRAECGIRPFICVRHLMRRTYLARCARARKYAAIYEKRIFAK